MTDGTDWKDKQVTVRFTKAQAKALLTAASYWREVADIRWPNVRDTAERERLTRVGNSLRLAEEKINHQMLAMRHRR